MRRCRTAIESQLPGALLHGFGQHDVEQLRVALYCAQRGLEEMINQANDPRWIKTLPDDLAGSLTSTLRALATALKRLVEERIPISGASDHGVSEAIYLSDPDQNGIELYWDRPEAEWPKDASGKLAMFNRPLDVPKLLSETA